MLGDLAFWIPDEQEAWVKADLVHIDKESKEVKVKNPKKERSKGKDVRGFNPFPTLV